MKIRNLFAGVLASGVLFTACNDDVSDNNANQQGETTYAKVELVNATGYETKAAAGTNGGTDLERKITSLEFYVFGEDGARDVNDSNGYIKYGEISNTRDKFVPVNAGTKIILVVANANLGEKATITTLAGMKKELAGLSLHTSNPREVPTNGIPMSGESKPVTVLPETAENVVLIEVSRLFTKLTTPVATDVEVEIDVKDDLTEIGLNKDEEITFALTGYAVINGLNESYIKYDYGTGYADFVNWAPASDMRYFKTTYNTTGQITSVYSGEKSGQFFLSGEDFVYAYENRPTRTTAGSSSSTVKDANTAYAMLIQGTLTDESGATKTRYWRLNISKDQNHDIYRNSIFNTEINKIRTVGFNTPEEAEEEEKPIPEEGDTAIIATITIANWNVFTDTGAEL